MATLESSKLKVATYNGEDGNLSVADASYTAAAASIADVIRMVELPAGSRIVGVNVVNDALGASSTLACGYEYKDSANGSAAPAAFKAATATSSAGGFSGAFHPLATFQDPIYVTLTVGGAAITGKVSVIVYYESAGSK